ncbi:RING finger and transmembrane domain-containing protein 2 isoform X2 [Corythoichthys intestinalis]|uniref:RING finger and transmembrane domain-containing protein 2-like isoform X1 n=1 Tax=Corythoichthys intestinalis TaxID=161448 RepID=UPI0025A58E15|nr:RING finger and transmembrane domain-containing protein 2-like isoform X1 [Corythoichthys intestinalis]XP_057687101.1 RING finger and transmembrane domain-containing protein 2 isoform X2 [Corythoichthys intestinalis]
MQRRHSSNTDGMPSERSRSQTVESESSLDEGGVFDCLKPDSPTSPQQIFSGLVGVPSGAVSSAQFQAASLVLGSHPDVFIQMTTLSREEGGPRRPEVGVFLPRPPHHHHNFHHPPPQHRTSSLLQQAAAATSERHHHGPREEVGQEDPSAPAPALSELKAVVSWLQRGFPFILILLAKVCFQHKLGIAVCVGLASTFTYANATFKHQVSLREERSVLMALWLALFLSGNVAYIYYAFRQEELHKSLMFSKPNLNGFDFFDLMWAVGINDFVLKFVTVGLKCFVLLLPGIFLAFKSRGKFYLLIEELSQLFRALVPIQLWYKYIMGEEPSASYFLGAALIIIYSLCKSFDICGRASSLRKALVLLCHSQSYGMRAGSQQCSDAGDICAICQADFREPVVLLCQHVFCEDCLSSWLDRERVCPLCRANVVETLRCWKDGTTSAHFQIY